MQVPPELDGAKVLLYTENKLSNNFGFLQYPNGHQEFFTGLAIAKYNNEREDDYYLFSCDPRWKVLWDTLHPSIEEAKKFAETQRYGKTEPII
jgi:hypothetical protein